MKLTESGIKKIDSIDECFNSINYTKIQDGDTVIYSNGYYHICFYTKNKDYITEDKRDIVYLIINEVLRQWGWI